MKEYVEIDKTDYDKLSLILDKLMNLEEIDESNFKGKYALENELASLIITLGQDFEISEHEIDMGNVSINNGILTMIDIQGNLNKYKLVERKANVGDIVRIIKTTNYTPFSHRHNERCFVVTKLPTKDELEWVQDHVVVGNWCLYHDQYIVLEKI